MFRNVCMFACIVTLTATGPTALAEDGGDVGVLAAVNRIITGTRPLEPSRPLSIKDTLIQNERLKTSDNGGGQVMFLDQTTLTLTPNSDIVLDRYVYDPQTKTGALAVTMLSGAMRMVGGRITKKTDAIIRTPSATIGIRGGIGHVTVRPDGSTRYMHIAGFSATIETAQGVLKITREGGVVEVNAPPQGRPFNPSAVDDTPQDDSATEQAPATTTAAALGADTGGDTTQPLVNEASDATPTAAPQRVDSPVLNTGPGVATYLGVATPEMVVETLGIPAGFGDGGTSTPDVPALVNAQIAPVTLEVSGVTGAVHKPPIATDGGQSGEFSQDQQPVSGKTVEQLSDEIQLESQLDDIVQAFDIITFDGTWSAVAGLTDGSFAPGTDDQTFQMTYSLLDQQGVVTVELPDGVGLIDQNIVLQDGREIRGDQFAVIGDIDRNIGGDDITPSLLGGDAADTALQISPNDVATGTVFIDYEAANLNDLSFVEGEIGAIQGIPQAIPDMVPQAGPPGNPRRFPADTFEPGN